MIAGLSFDLVIASLSFDRAKKSLARSVRVRMERGQTLLEALVAVATVSLVLAAVFAALATAARAKGSDEARAGGTNAAANAAAELRAAVEYDPAALAAVGNATWTVTPPSPPPGAAPSDGAPVTLSTTVTPQGSNVMVGLTFASTSANGSTTLVLQQYAPAPGDSIFAAGATPAPSP